MDHLSYRICGITSYRVHVANHYDRVHWRKDYVTIQQLLCLEVLLGVVAACLPVLQPVFDRLSAPFSKHAADKSGHTRLADVENRTSKQWTEDTTSPTSPSHELQDLGSKGADMAKPGDQQMKSAADRVDEWHEVGLNASHSH